MGPIRFDFKITCYREKMPRHHPYGLLEPLPIPRMPWQSIALDFITDLPVSKGFDVILTIVDRYTNMAHFLPCTKEISSEETAETVMREVCRHHGLPDSIISGCGPQLISKFWKDLFKMLKFTCNNLHPKSNLKMDLSTRLPPSSISRLFATSSNI